MCKPSTPDTPPPPPPVKPPAPPPKELDQGVRRAGDDERRRITSARGSRATMLTGSSGLTNEAKLGKQATLGGS